MSVRSDRTAQPDAVIAETSSEIAALNLGGDHVNATIAAAQNADSALAPANSLSTNNPDHPLKRSIVVNIRASLSDLALRKTKGTWAPSGDALRSILQSRKFTDLSGNTEASGDLKSVNYKDHRTFPDAHFVLQNSSDMLLVRFCRSCSTP